MPSDAEYLASAGIESAETPTTAETTTETTAEPTAQEMFELYAEGKPHKFPLTSEFPITHNGKVQKVPFSKLANTYRQASHFENKFKEFNTQKTQFEKQRAEYDKAKGFYDKYGQFQEWSEQNPEAWQRIWDLYQNRDKVLSQQENNPMLDEVNGLKQQLQELSQFKSNWEKSQEEQQTTQDVEFVKSEINSFAKDFPEINLEEQDEDGVKVWAKVVQFGLDNNLPDFESAALKYFKPELADVYAARARAEATKGFQKARASGEVARSPQPFNMGQGERKIDFRKTSYGELLDLAREAEAKG
jgi:hypothetical protein